MGTSYPLLLLVFGLSFICSLLAGYRVASGVGSPSLE